MKKTLKRIFGILGAVVLLYIIYFLIVRRSDRTAMEAGNFYQPPAVGSPMLLPSLFLEGQRFYLKLPTVSGDTVLAYGDTGGGISMALDATIERLHLGGAVRRGILKGLMPMRYIRFADLVRGSACPAPVQLRHLQLRRPIAAEAAPFLLIPPEDEEIKTFASVMKLDVFLGQNFFMGKAWTIDYLRQQIWVNTPLPAGELGKPGVQRLGFRKNARGEKTHGHPSMVIEVDGATLAMLFDTGATIILSDSGKAALHTGAATIGGSFIAASIFDKWRQAHPEWRFYKAADGHNDVIEVPRIRMGGYEAGPVLFARRPDAAWSEGMISSMDKVVKGAIGGSALKYFRVMIDYNSELLKLEL